MKLRFRMNTPDDKAELIQLWTDFAEWDSIDERTWEHRFGKAEIALAIDEATGRIVGQTIFIPAPVYLNGREISAFRPLAAYLVKEARSPRTLNPMNHPIVQLYWVGADSLREKGVQLIHMLPDPLWGRTLQLLPAFQLAKFPLWSLQLPLPKQFSLPENYSVFEIIPSDNRLNDLWSRAARLYGRSAVRDAERLTWKTSHFQHFYRGIERDGDLVGFAASRPKDRDRQWLIGDITAADPEALEVMILAACNQANEFRKDHPTMDKAAILATEKILPVVQKAGFARDNYTFVFAVQRLDPSLDQADIAPSRWYVAAND